MDNQERAKALRKGLTTGKVASLLGVAARTVSKWCDTKALASYRLPGPGRQRRVTHQALLEFCQTNSLPVPPELLAILGWPLGKAA